MTSVDWQAHAYADLLSPAERTRAASFCATVHRVKFEISRGVLRLLLGHYLGENPRELEIEVGSHGKPFVTHPAGLTFNLAHSGDLALYAFSRLEVGIDIEQLRPVSDLMNVARRFFSPTEAAELVTLQPEERPRAFHRCWARKEAYIKALGVGLSMPLESFSVSLLPGDPPFIRGKDEWRLLDLPVADNYAAALAVRASEVNLWISPTLSATKLTSVAHVAQILSAARTSDQS